MVLFFKTGWKIVCKIVCFNPILHMVDPSMYILLLFFCTSWKIACKIVCFNPILQTGGPKHVYFIAIFQNKLKNSMQNSLFWPYFTNRWTQSRIFRRRETRREIRLGSRLFINILYTRPATCLYIAERNFRSWPTLHSLKLLFISEELWLELSTFTAGHCADRSITATADIKNWNHCTSTE